MTLSTNNVSLSNEGSHSLKEEKNGATEVRRIDSKVQDKNTKKPKDLKLVACLASLTLTLFITALDVLIVGTIIDSVAAEFGDYAKTGWLVTGYSLPNAVLSLLWGRFATRLGFRSSVVCSIIIFEVGSLVSALANSMNMLIAGRVVSGIGGSGLQTLCFIIGCTMVSERSRPLVISLLSCAFAVASVAGPFLGGAFTTHVTWRWCFYINLPIGGLALAIFLVTYNPENTGVVKRLVAGSKSLFQVDVKPLFRPASWPSGFRNAAFGFDIIGLVFCCVGLVLFLLGLTFGGTTYPWGSGQVVAYLVVGIILSVVFLVYDFAIFRKMTRKFQNPSFRPLLSWEIISKPAVYTSNMVTFLLTLAYNGQMIYSVQFFQLVFNSSPYKAGIHLIPIVVSTVIASIFSGVVTKKTGQVKPVLLFGVVAGVVGGGLCVLLDNHSNGSTQIGVLILPGVALGFALQAALMSSQLGIDKASPSFRVELVEITAFNTFMKSLGSTFGGVLSTMVFSTSVHNKVKRSSLHELAHESVNNIVKGRMEHFDGPRSELGNIMSDSIKNVFWMDLGFCALAFIFGVFTSNKKSEVEKKASNNEVSDIESQTQVPTETETEK